MRSTHGTNVAFHAFFFSVIAFFSSASFFFSAFSSSVSFFAGARGCFGFAAATGESYGSAYAQRILDPREAGMGGAGEMSRYRRKEVGG